MVESNVQGSTAVKPASVKSWTKLVVVVGPQVRGVRGVVVLVSEDEIDEVEAGVDVAEAVALGIPAPDHLVGVFQGAGVLAQGEGGVGDASDDTAAL